MSESLSIVSVGGSYSQHAQPAQGGSHSQYAPSAQPARPLSTGLSKYISDTETLLEQARTAKALLDQNPGLELLLISLMKLGSGTLGDLEKFFQRGSK